MGQVVFTILSFQKKEGINIQFSGIQGFRGLFEKKKAFFGYCDLFKHSVEFEII